MNHRPDQFTRACLVTIILLLGIIAGQQFWRLESVRAQSAPSYKTEIIDDGPDSASRVDKIVQDRAREGWQLVSSTVYFYNYPNKAGPLYLLVFRK
jgi:hypothetical protein